MMPLYPEGQKLENMLSWYHSGFNVYIGDRIEPNDKTGLGNLARLVTHIPGRYEHTVRCYGYFSNKSRGMRKKADTYAAIPAIIPNELSSKETKQNLARLIQKVYEVNPLICPKCQGQMKIISIIDDFEIMDKILKHLDLWDIRNHDPPPQKVSDIVLELVCDGTDFRIPVFDEWY